MLGESSQECGSTSTVVYESRLSVYAHRCDFELLYAMVPSHAQGTGDNGAEEWRSTVLSSSFGRCREFQLLCFECIGAVRSGSHVLSTTLTGQGKSSAEWPSGRRIRSWLSLSPPPELELDISMTSPRSAMNSAKVGLSALDAIVLRSFEPR